MTSSPKGTILITGATGGLGRGLVAKILATPELASHHGIFTARDASSAPAKALRAELLKSGRKAKTTAEIVSLDLCRLSSVREVAASVRARVAAGEIPPIRALVLNAGLNDMGRQAFTEDGFDVSFASCYLGHWLLTLLLLGSMDPENGRVVVLGSSAYDVDHPIMKSNGMYSDEKWRTFFPGTDADAVARGTWCKNEDDTPNRAGVRRYGAAKMCCAMMVAELQRRLDADPALRGISVVGVDPGSMSTGIVRRGDWFTRYVIFWLLVPVIAYLSPGPSPIFRTVARSANDVLNAAFEAGPRLRGKYLDGSAVQDLRPEAQDAGKREMVWRDSVRYTGLKQEETALAAWA